MLRNMLIITTSQRNKFVEMILCFINKKTSLKALLLSYLMSNSRLSKIWKYKLSMDRISTLVQSGLAVCYQLVIVLLFINSENRLIIINSES